MSYLEAELSEHTSDNAAQVSSRHIQALFLFLFPYIFSFKRVLLMMMVMMMIMWLSKVWVAGVIWVGCAFLLPLTI